MKKFVGISILFMAVLSCANSDRSTSAPPPTPHTFGAAGGTTSAIIPASWTVPAWFIDPANSSGTASDSNSCTSSGTPCLTWHEINDHRWGCIGSPSGCPRLQQTTTITWLSNDSTDNDPVYFLPTIEKSNAYVALNGTLSGGTTTTLTSVTSGGAATRTALELAAPASGTFAAGDFIVNTTHAGAAWAYTVSSGAIWKLTQPMGRTTTPIVGFSPPTELTNWANGDAITFYTSPTKVNLVTVLPTITDENSNANYVTINNIQVTSPLHGNDSLDVLHVNSGVVFQECTSQREIHIGGMAGIFSPISSNNYLSAGVSSLPMTAGAYIVGGEIVPTRSGTNTIGVSFDGDIIFSSTGSYVVQGPNILLGAIYVDTSTVLAVTGNTYLNPTFGPYSQAIVWGPGILNAASRIAYASGAGEATAIFKSTLNIDRITTFCLGNPNAVATTLTCNTSLTATNLDSSLGTSVTGCAYVPGGGSFCNFSSQY